MQIHERIKRIREFRGLTQRELGIAIGCTEASAAVRIGQYETGARTPKKESAVALAKALHCNFRNFTVNDLGPAERIMFELFWLEELVAGSMYVFQLGRYKDENDKRVLYGQCNDWNYTGVFPPVALAMDYTLINDFMREWAIRFNELSQKEISQDEYFEWKINWPYTCDDGGRFEPSVQWRK